MLQAPWACLAQHRITIFCGAQFLSFVPQPTLFLFLKMCTKKPQKQFFFIQAFLYWVEKWAISEAFEHYIWSSNFWIGPCLFLNRYDSGAMIFRSPPPPPDQQSQAWYCEEVRPVYFCVLKTFLIKFKIFLFFINFKLICF